MTHPTKKMNPFDMWDSEPLSHFTVIEEDDIPQHRSTGLFDQFGCEIARYFPSEKQGFTGFIRPSWASDFYLNYTYEAIDDDTCQS